MNFITLVLSILISSKPFNHMQEN